jgi:hypothetical protein
MFLSYRLSLLSARLEFWKQLVRARDLHGVMDAVGLGECAGRRRPPSGCETSAGI